MRLDQSLDLSQVSEDGVSFAQLGVAPGTEFAALTAKASGTAVGFNVGVHYKPIPDIQLGARFLSKLAFNYTGKPGDPAIFEGVRLYRYEVPLGKGPTRVGWDGKEGRQAVVLAGRRYEYTPALVDRQENGTLSASRQPDGAVRLTGVYHYDSVLFVIDQTFRPGAAALLEADETPKPRPPGHTDAYAG